MQEPKTTSEKGTVTLSSSSEKETERIAARVAKQLKAGDVVCLHGDLGAGKTRFVKGVAAAFGIDRNLVNSPTFTLINEYPGEIPIYHFDCYRLRDAHEAIAIGAEEYFYGSGICLIEWAEKIAALIPEDAMHITIEKKGQSDRQFNLKPPLE